MRIVIGLLALLAVACTPTDDINETPTAAPAVGTCIERPATDVLDRAADEPVGFQIRPTDCDRRPNLRVTEHLPASAISVGDPFTGRPGGPNCDPPAKRWALVTLPGQQVVICLADQP